MTSSDPAAPEGALVLLSGGQDSAVCLAWALERFERVETLGFDYGQRHRVELACRRVLRGQIAALKPSWAPKLASDHMVDLAGLEAISETALTRNIEIMMTESGLPSSFVPGRNILFFTYAGAIAYRRGLKHLVGGMCETDYSGYPDCRDDTLKALQVALSLGMDRRLVIHTPLMWLDKAQTWDLTHELGSQLLVDLIRWESHSCYNGVRDVRRDWGYGCGECPACELRAAGWVKYQSQRALVRGQL
jgi:7-cyano-7-deazaguanine synthase